MKKGDFLWAFVMAGIIAFLVFPATHKLFIQFTSAHSYLAGFFKFLILSTMGELLALRIVTGDWSIPEGMIFRSIVWGLLGMIIVLIFETFSSGIKGALTKGLLPGDGSPLVSAFFVSAIMNTTFAPTMMTFHRLSDTYIDLRCKSKGEKVTLKKVIAKVDWESFISFVIIKTIPIFWIPAHTIVFLLPAEYRILAAAMLSIALGAILAFSKKKSETVKVQSAQA